MRANRGYHSYRGRPKTGKILLVTVLVVLLLLSGSYLVLQDHIVYESDGSITFDFLNREEEVDMEELRRQFDDLSAAASVWTELSATHPASIRRVLTSEAFTHCDILYQWRPELKSPGMALRSKAEVDAECEKYTALFKEKKGGRGK